MAPPIKSDAAIASTTTVCVPEIRTLFDRDGYLKPYEEEICRRLAILLSYHILIVFRVVNVS